MIKSIFTNRTLTNYHTYHLPELGKYHISPSTPAKVVYTSELCGDGHHRSSYARIPKDLNPTKVAELGLQRYYEGGFEYHPDAGIGACGRLLIRRIFLNPTTEQTADSEYIWALENGNWVRIDDFCEKQTGRHTHTTRRIFRDGTEVAFRTFDNSDFMQQNIRHTGTWLKRNGVWYEDQETSLNYGPLPELENWHSGDMRVYVKSFNDAVINDPSVDWRIGWEIEKEDTTARDRARRMNNRLPYGWHTERDGSLDSSGVEFISCVYDLMDTEKQLAHFNEFRWAIDSACTTNCGGHITISRRGMNSEELLNKLFPFIPLFFSIYEGRLNKSLCGIQTKSEIEGRSRKAIHIKDAHCVEIRIPSKVDSVESLAWRLRLMRFIAKSIDANKFTHYSEVAEALFEDTKLKKIMNHFYADDRLRRKQSLTYLFGSLLEDDHAVAFKSDDEQERLLERMRMAWNSVRSVVQDAVTSKFSTSKVNSKLTKQIDTGGW
jgi:hypothetical protein